MLKGQSLSGLIRDVKDKEKQIFLFGILYSHTSDKAGRHGLVEGIFGSKEERSRGVFIAKNELHRGKFTVSFMLRNKFQENKYFVVEDPQSILDLYSADIENMSYFTEEIEYLMSTIEGVESVPFSSGKQHKINYRQALYDRIYKLGLNCYHGIEASFSECINQNQNH